MLSYRYVEGTSFLCSGVDLNLPFVHSAVYQWLQDRFSTGIWQSKKLQWGLGHVTDDQWSQTQHVLHDDCIASFHVFLCTSFLHAVLPLGTVHEAMGFFCWSSQLGRLPEGVQRALSTFKKLPKQFGRVSSLGGSWWWVWGMEAEEAGGCEGEGLQRGKCRRVPPSGELICVNLETGGNPGDLQPPPVHLVVLPPVWWIDGFCV